MPRKMQSSRIDGMPWRRLACCVALLLAVTPARTAREPPSSEQEGARLHAQMRQKWFCSEVAAASTIPETSWKTLPNGIKMLVYSDGDVVSGWINKAAIWEQYEVNMIIGVLNQTRDPSSPNYTPPVFVDIGANVGWYTYHIGQAGFQTYSFEGMQRNALMIRHTLCANPSFSHRVTLYQTGLGSTKLTCRIMSGTTNKGDGVVDCSNSTLPKGAEWRGNIHINLLDTFLDEDIRVMKVDVEGFEPQVLKGAVKLFKNRKIDYILTEFNKGGLALLNGGEAGIKEWVDTYVQLGYRISLTDFKGPFLNKTEVQGLPKRESIFNMFLSHERVDDPEGKKAGGSFFGWLG